MFKVGEPVIHFLGFVWGTVIGYKEIDGITHVVIKHEDPYYKDEYDGITLWLPKVLRANNTIV